MKNNARKLQFQNARGQTLAAQAELPLARAPRAWALFAHCFTCSRNIQAARTLSRALAGRGIAVLRFDFTGLGQSEGEFADTSFSSNVQDLIAAAQFLEREYEAPKLLIGHSLGGTAILQAAAAIPSSVAVATIGSPFDPTHVAQLLADSRPEIEARGEAEVQLGGRPFRIRKEFIEDLGRQDMPRTVRNLRRALLVLHSPVDEIVEVDNAAQIFAHAMHPKSFVSLDNADHLLSDPADARYAANVLAAWAGRFLGEDEKIAEGAAEGEVIARIGAVGFRTEMDVGGHELIADEPGSVGGNDEGPSPYSLLSAALAACTAMTLRMYAARKSLPVAAVQVRVRHDKIHAQDCANCETSAGRVDRFDRTLRIDGDLTASQRERMMEIADMCPVHRTLHSEVLVETRVEETD